MNWRLLTDWYKRHGRELPWRGKASDYAVTVSEFMLQQTQVSRVVPLYRNFLKRFPGWSRLARASQADVVRAWRGLGYNLRALRLREAAQAVMAKWGGRLPEDPEALRGLKGVGPYMERALRVFVHRERALAPDTNIRRVLTRHFLGPTADPVKVDWKKWERWENTLTRNASYDVNQGLMDLGATICLAGRPKCAECPLIKTCRSYPRILKLKKMELPRQKAARRERVDKDGIPNRIHRGRLLERLRSGSVRLVDLDPGQKNALPGLKKDRLISVKNDRIRLA
jgi:A/G-specific adenine glycosylase